VEDAPVGIRAGKAAGARVIALPTTSDRVELERAGADWVVRNCADIAAAFDGENLVLTIAL
jgi:beta-phosphoglucomutase-like phosphatase (HAD superfamily)